MSQYCYLLTDAGEQQFRGRRVKSILSTQGEIVLSSQNLWWCVLLILYVYIGEPEERCAPGRTWSAVFDQDTVRAFYGGHGQLYIMGLPI
jgi:hypothetical protein